jgi:integrase
MPGHVRPLKDRDGRIKKRGDNSTIWQARWRPPGDTTDAQRIEKVFRTKREAERWMSTMEADALRGAYLDPRSGQVQFSKVADEWKETWSRLAPKTRVGYTSILNKHVLPEFGSKRVAAIQPEHVQAFHNGLASRLKPNTVRRVMDVLRGVLALAVKRRYIASNPASTEAVELAPRNRTIEITPLTHEQVSQLVQALPEHWRLPVLLDAYTGLRAGELWALKRSSVTAGAAELSITHALKEVTREQSAGIPADQRLTDSLLIGPTKTRQTRKVSVPAFLRAELAQHLLAQPPNPHDLVFTTPQGTPVRHNQFAKRVFIPAARAALPDLTTAAEARAQKERADHDLPPLTASQLKNTSPIRFHDLRHTCATWLIAAGAHPLQIKLRLGHESIRTTMDTYGHLFPSAEPELAALLDQARNATAASPDPTAPESRGNLGETLQIASSAASPESGH